MDASDKDPNQKDTQKVNYLISGAPSPVALDTNTC